MNTLNEYYLFEKDPNGNSQERRELISSNVQWEGFLGCPQTWIYLSSALNNGTTEERISNASEIHLFSVYKPEYVNTLLGYGDRFGFGDIKGSKDAILVVLSEDNSWLEIFIAKGLRNQRNLLFSLIRDGELWAEIEQIRKDAKPPNRINIQQAA